MWALWWLGLFAVPVIQWPSLSMMASARMTWALWCVVLGISSAWRASPRRYVAVPWLGCWLLGLGLRQLVLVFPSVIWVPWTQAWETVATCSSVWCWWVAIGWGTLTLLRESPRLDLAPALHGALWVNLVAAGLQVTGLWSRWLWWENVGGLLQNSTIWGAWCALSLPVLYGYRKGYALPALLGLLCAHSTSAWLAAGCGWWWLHGRTLRPWHVLAIGAGIVGSKWALGITTLTSLRLGTWVAVLPALWRHPWGIGWGELTFRQVVHAPWPILPHASSDLLRLPLEAGWWVLPLVAYGLWAFADADDHSPLGASLVTAGVLACVQTSLSLAAIGVLAWALWIQWWISRRSHEPQEG